MFPPTTPWLFWRTTAVKTAGSRRHITICVWKAPNQFNSCLMTFLRHPLGETLICLSVVGCALIKLGVMGRLMNGQSRRGEGEQAAGRHRLARALITTAHKENCIENH